MNILIDSSIFIEHLRTFFPGKNTVLSHLIAKKYNLYFSMITVGEVYSGESAPADDKEIEEIFAMGNIVDMNYRLIKSAGEIRRKTHVSLIDAIIAATALELDLTVATLNHKNFEKVKGLKLHKNKK